MTVIAVAAAMSAIPLAASLAPGIASASTRPVRAVAIRLPSNAAPASNGYLYGVACVRTGSCEAGGAYTDSSGAFEPMVVAESAGRWARASELKLPSNAESDPLGEVNSVACASVGNCVAVGYYNGNALFQGFVATESRGKWQRAFLVVLPSNTSAATEFQVNGVACTGNGSCVAIGGYRDKNDHFQAMVATESRGKWARAQELRMPSNAAENPDAFLPSVSCVRTGACVAAGEYADKAGDVQAVIADDSGGKWRQAIEIGLPRGAAANPEAGLNTVACTGVGACIAVGSYLDHLDHSHAFTVTQSAGRWGRGSNLSAIPSNAAANSEPYLESVACASAKSCVAVGGYIDRAGGRASFAAVRLSRRWTASQIMPPSNSQEGGSLDTSIYSVACARSGYCTAVGFYIRTSDKYTPMAATIP